MNITIPVNRFTSGEISPKLAALIDTELYNSSCRVLENFVVTNQGTLRRRPGSYYLGEAAAEGPSVFFEFRSSNGKYFMIEIYPTQYYPPPLNWGSSIRIWIEDGTLFYNGSTLVTFPAGFKAEDLKEVKAAVTTDEIWFVHKNSYPIRVRFNPNTNLFDFLFMNFITKDSSGTLKPIFEAEGEHPGAICFYGGRLFLASTIKEPSSIWASKPLSPSTGTDNYQNFDFEENSPQPNSAIKLIEKDLLGSEILWLLPQKRLIAATTKTTWLSDDQPPMPDTFDMSIQSYNGSANIAAKIADNIIVYVGRDGISLRLCAYSNEAGGLVDKNISKAAEHIVRKGITSISVQTNPETTIWVSLKDGTFASCLINFEEGIVAWSRHNLQGGFVESLNILSKEGGDDLYICVKRKVNAQEKRYVEVIHLSEIELEKEEEHFVDCGKRFIVPENNKTLTGLNFLEGEELVYLSNGAIKPPVTVSQGKATVEIDKNNAVVHIGIPFESRILFKHLETPANGTSQGKNKKIEKVTLRVFESRGGAIGQFVDKLQPLLYELFGKITFGDIPDPFTGDVYLDIHGSTDKAPDLWIVVKDPVGFHLLGAFVKVNIINEV